MNITASITLTSLNGKRDFIIGILICVEKDLKGNDIHI